MAFVFNPFTGTLDQKLVVEGTSSEISGNLVLNDGYISNDGGDEGIRIDNNGKVGIGVADPDTTLEILNASAAQLKLTKDDTYYTTFAMEEGALEMTIAGGLDLNIGGGQNFRIYEGGTGSSNQRFLLSNSGLTTKMRVSASTGSADYFEAEVEDDGATTLSTVDSDSAVPASGHLTLDPDGELILTPVTEVKSDAPLKIKEAADAVADTAAYGQLWVKTATPNELYFTTDAGNDIQITSGTDLSVILVQSDQPTAISEFDDYPFIYGTTYNRLYHKVDGATMAYETMTEVSFTFSISDTTFRTASSGGSETANVILVGTATNMYVDVNYNNDVSPLDGAPTIHYKKNDDGNDTSGATDTSSLHLATSTSGSSHTSGTAFVVPATTSASDSSSDGAFSRHAYSGDYFTVRVSSTDGGVTDTDVSERYTFLNGIVWGSCAATTGPTAAEFLESFSAGLNATGGKGYAFPMTSGSFSDSYYHSNFGSRQITADSGSEYMFFGWPDQGGAATTIKAPNGDDISGDFRTLQTFGSTSTYPNSAGYMETYNVYVSNNAGVNLEVTVT